ncbi:MAG: MBL fold metallo-hydrolase [Deltaproteobacteria bacterium]|nr:MBL fold metallo-hydrolase [Deltaproteobacteria bacterium]
MDRIGIKEVDRVEILTLQDNYIDLLDQSSSAIISRAAPLKDMYIKNSIIAEHGFSALVRISLGSETRALLFDFGYSNWGVLHNIDALGVNLNEIELACLSHGHMDHFGGMLNIVKTIERDRLDLVVHPAAFRPKRYIKFGEEIKVYFPALDKKEVMDAGVNIVETTGPRSLLDGYVIFLGEIPRETAFEKGMPNGFYEEDNGEIWDPIEDDTAIVMNLRSKGLVVLSGCAHSGVINTVNHARRVTGIENVHAIMGGFHLSGPVFEPIIAPTIDELKKIDPDYVIPTHCTGRSAMLQIEHEMPSKFLLNMSGTRMTFPS